MFELVEETFNTVAFGIQSKVGLSWSLDAGARWDDGHRARLLDGFNNLFAVVSLVCNDDLRRKAIQQRLSLCVIRGLPGRQDEAQGIAQPVNGSVYFRGQAAF